LAIVHAATAAADGGRLVARALTKADIEPTLRTARAVDVIAAGKAAGPMIEAFRAHSGVDVRTELRATPADAGHPVPDARSVAAGVRALQIASGVQDRELLVVLLSGGASALMAVPAEGVALEAKRETIRTIMTAGGDITELNTVRKHLSAIKGGRLAAACAGGVLTLALSDVVGGDLAVIGSGPTVPDSTSWQMALDVLERRGGRSAYPPEIVALIENGVAGRLSDTPKPGDRRLARSVAHVIGGAADAVAGAQHAAHSAGYHVRVIDTPVVGEARLAAAWLAEEIAHVAVNAPRPLCVLSCGETTVRVTGRGKGGRNQELALAMLAAGPAALAALPPARSGRWLFSSIGSDGVDGPTDAAGALVDHTTATRAAARALRPAAAYLDDNDSYAFFAALDDLVRTGRTNTNVGDLQIMLLGE
jgi:glycerate 2-kinase